MSRPPRTHSPKPLTTEIREYRSQLDAACQQKWGVSGGVYRTFDRLYNMLVIIFTGYVMEFQGVEPIIAMGFAVILIAGWEGFTEYLLQAGNQSHAPSEADAERSDGE